MRRILALAVGLVLVFLVMIGCGYNTTGRSSGSLGNVYLPFFDDLTSGDRVNNLGPRLTDMLFSEFAQDKDIRVYQGVNERDLADRELLGTVQRFSETVMTRDEQETGEEYRVVITCSIQYNDLATGKSLWQDGNVVGDGYYFLEAGEVGFEDAVRDALAIILDKILDKTVRAW
jgi:hypothetical protein